MQKRIVGNCGEFGEGGRGTLQQYPAEWCRENKDQDPIDHLAQGACATMKTKIDCAVRTLN